VDAHAVYVGGYRLTALDRHTGSSLWESELFGVSTPAVADRRLFVNAQDPEFGLSAVDERTGDLLWNNQATGEAGDVPAVANGVVFEVAESGPLVAVDAADGTLLASETDPAGRPFDAGTGGNRIAQVAIAGGRVYVATAADGGPNGIDVFEARRR
jgi:outer membrane protein assembly factor BamB